MVRKLIGLSLFLSMACPLFVWAGVYMGTAEVGNQQQVVSGAPPVSAPFVGSPLAQEAYSDFSANCEPYTGKGPMPARPCPTVAPVVAVSAPIVVQVRPGSLKNNIARIANEAGWEKVVWDPNYDYEWVGNVTITANDIQGVLSKLLEPYPLQAIFYNANHVVEILPRRNT